MAEGDYSLLYSGRSARNIIPFESQLLSVGGGFVVFVALVALLATIHNRRKRRPSNDFRAPLIHHSNLGSIKSISSTKGRGFFVQPMTRPNGGMIGGARSPRQTPSPTSASALQSPQGSDSSGASPQCVPITPYAAFDATRQQALHYSTGIMPPSRVRADSCASGSSAGSIAAFVPPLIASDNRGSLSLQLSYDATSKALQVTILACHDLPELCGGSAEADVTSSASHLNPYVKLRVLPENQHRIKTRVLRGTRNPFYDETFTMYGINENNVKGCSLHLAVLAFDPYNHDMILGESIYHLSQLDFTNTCQKLSTTLKLKARENIGEQRGQVLISMAYNQQSNSINFAVLKMKDLPKDNAIGLMDPHAKVYMLVDGERRIKQKTHVKKKTREPIFNESFAFELAGVNVMSADALDRVAFHVNVLNHDGVTRNELIGHCAIDSHSQQFAQCRAAPGQQHSEWYSILP